MQKSHHVYKGFKPELWHGNIGKKQKPKTKQQQPNRDNR